MQKNSLTLSHPSKKIKGEIILDGSKSISNRLLIISALCKNPFLIKNLSTSKDTETLSQLLAQMLAQKNNIYDANAAGTTFRFLTAFLAMQPGTQTLTGTPRLCQRPIAPLVEVLNLLGANIEYADQQGFAPLLIHEPTADWGKNNSLQIPADVSSQFVSALLLIAPSLPRGLELTLIGEKTVSSPYINMTLQLLQTCGVASVWNENTISIAPQTYHVESDVSVEADWSAAAYYYEMATFADEVDLTLVGLAANSLQSDAAMATLAERAFGVQTTFTDRGVRLQKNGKPPRALVEYDFLDCPDLAQAVSITCAGTGANGLFSGLETLHGKETDRIAALKSELLKLEVFFTKVPPRFASKTRNKIFYLQEKKATFDQTKTPFFETYDDHRMAMSLAPLAILADKIEIANPSIVEKSYPNYWKDLEKLGFQVV